MEEQDDGRNGVLRSIRTEENAVVIRLSGEPVPGRGELLRLVRRSLENSGYAPWPETEAECFAAGEEVLVIARPGGPGMGAFFFPDLETLLAGAACLTGEDGAVYAAEGGYILTLPAGGVRPALYEFGRELRLPPLWEYRAREMERCLIPAHAPRVLRETFRQDSFAYPGDVVYNNDEGILFPSSEGPR